MDTAREWNYQRTAGDHHYAIYDEKTGNDVALTREFDESIASLIAAAPKMLAALDRAESFISGFEDDESQDGIDELLADIRAAIAKAKGATHV
jgi:hypothetical protein